MDELSGRAKVGSGTSQKPYCRIKQVDSVMVMEIVMMILDREQSISWTRAAILAITQSVISSSCLLSSHHQQLLVVEVGNRKKEKNDDRRAKLGVRVYYWKKSRFSAHGTLEIKCVSSDPPATQRVCTGKHNSSLRPVCTTGRYRKVVHHRS
jgi:hypothetical protein